MREVGRALDRGDAEAAHLLRQPRLRLRDAVLHQLLRLVGIGAELEGDGQRHQAVGRRLAAHVEHVLDAVDLLLDRRRHGLGDDLRIGAGILRAHHHRRRHDLGIFGDRQHAQREQAGEEDQDREHAGEDRPVDEEFGEVHGRCSPRVLPDASLQRACPFGTTGCALRTRRAAPAARGRASMRDHLRRDQRARTDALQAVDDDALARLQAAGHDAQAVDATAPSVTSR